MNLFKLSLRPSYYLKHPLYFFREIHHSIKYAWQRITKGYSWYDSADMDDFLLHIIPGMLRDIANGDAYPGAEPFETYKKWQDYCNSLADVFESLQEENWNVGRNEWEEELEKAIEIKHSHTNLTTTINNMTIEEADEVFRMYFEREKELWEKRSKLLKDAFRELSTNFDKFWI